MRFKYKIGKCKYENDSASNEAEIEWKLENGKFSASGCIWKRNKSDHLIGGQVLEELKELFPEDELVSRIVSVWQKWHLNDLTAGSPRQTEFLAQFPNQSNNNYYEWAKDKLKDAGLEPDEDFIYNEKAYSYGSAWLHTELPSAIVCEIESWSSFPNVNPIN